MKDIKKKTFEVIENFSYKNAVELQKNLRKVLLKTEPIKFKSFPQLVAGCDVTFLNPYKTPTTAIASVVILNTQTLKSELITVEETEVNIPYIPTLLAFRELPVLIKVIEKTTEKLSHPIELLIVDGHGISHPRRLGIATHLGMVTGIPTIGCAKKILCGKHFKLGNKRGSISMLIHETEVIGAAVRTRTNTKPIFVSSGFKVKLPFAIKVTLKLAKYRLPEPTRLAHNSLVKYRRRLINEQSALF